MKKSAKLIELGIFLTVVLAAGVLFAQQPVRKGGAAAPTTRLPDLTIEKIYLTKDCSVAVRVKNLGPGFVSDTVWTAHTPKSAGVYLYHNGSGSGGGSIWKFDPAKNLQKPGGTATYISKLKVTSTAKIKAVVDRWDVVREANEKNNSLVTKLFCKPVVGCCIAGKYEGISVDDPNCPVGPAEPSKFIMVIKQTNCGSNINGDLIDAATGALTSRLVGEVVPGPGKCCTIIAESRELPGGPDALCRHNIKAVICKKAANGIPTTAPTKVLQAIAAAEHSGLCRSNIRSQVRGRTVFAITLHNI